MRKLGYIVTGIIWIVIIIWAIYHREAISVWLERPIAELPTRQLLGICCFSVWLVSMIPTRK